LLVLWGRKGLVLIWLRRRFVGDILYHFER
jgi:hypothetical protein